MPMSLHISSHKVTADSFNSHVVQPSHFTDKKRGGQSREAPSSKISILVVGRLVKNT